MSQVSTRDSIDPSKFQHIFTPAKPRQQLLRYVLEQRDSHRALP